MEEEREKKSASPVLFFNQHLAGPVCYPSKLFRLLDFLKTWSGKLHSPKGANLTLPSFCTIKASIIEKTLLYFRT